MNNKPTPLHRAGLAVPSEARGEGLDPVSRTNRHTGLDPVSRTNRHTGLDPVSIFLILILTLGISFADPLIIDDVTYSDTQSFFNNDEITLTNATMLSGSQITIKSETEIIFQNGFTAATGSTIDAKIMPIPEASVQEGTEISSRLITLNLNCNEAMLVMISEDPEFASGEWEYYAPQKNWLLSPGSGLKTVYIKYKLYDHDETIPLGVQMTLNDTGPTVNIEAVQNNTGTVAVHLDAPGALEVMLSEDRNFTDAVWEPYEPIKYFEISDSEGRKNVYVRFKYPD